jgi:predicted nucleotidyltransferase
MSIFAAAAEICSFLEDNGVSYAILGGLALQHWGEPRNTQDVDIVVLVPSKQEDDFLKATLQHFHPRMADAQSFARRYRVLLIEASNHVPIDLALGIPGYEEEALRRVSKISFAGLAPVRILSAEDLIIHKCVAGRPRDVEDVERVLIRQRVKLDLRYIRRWLRDFAQIIDAHDPRAIFEGAVKKARALLRRKSRT